MFAALFTLLILLTVRNMLIVFALFSLIMALINFVTSVLLCVALRKVSTMFSHPFNKHISLSFHSCLKARETWSTETHTVQKGNTDALMPSINSRNPIRSIKFQFPIQLIGKTILLKIWYQTSNDICGFYLFRNTNERSCPGCGHSPYSQFGVSWLLSSLP